MPQEEFKQGDKFILTLGKPSDIYPNWWEVETTDMVFPKLEVPESFFCRLPRYTEPTEQTEIPLFVRDALNRRANELLKEIGERVKDLEEERDAIMDFLDGKVGEKK